MIEAINKPLNKPIVLSKKNFFLLKKITLFTAFSLICLSFIFLTFGAIPLRERSMTAISVANSILEIINMGNTSIVYLAANVVFIVFYIYSLVRMIVDIISFSKRIKKWATCEVDNDDDRIKFRDVLIRANANIFRYLLLVMISYMVSAFNLGGIGILMICLLIGGSLFLNASKYILYKGDLVDSLIVSLNRTIIMIAPLLLIVFAQLQAFDVFYAVIRIFTAMGRETFTSEFLGQFFCESILKPSFYFITWVFLVKLNKQINEKTFDEEISMKKIIITDAVFLGLFVLILGFTSNSTNVLEYFKMIWRNISLIIIVAVTYISSLNIDSELNDTEFVSTDSDNTEKNENTVENNGVAQESQN